jgi:hypothetical protein
MIIISVVGYCVTYCSLPVHGEDWGTKAYMTSWLKRLWLSQSGSQPSCIWTLNRSSVLDELLQQPGFKTVERWTLNKRCKHAWSFSASDPLSRNPVYEFQRQSKYDLQFHIRSSTNRRLFATVTGMLLVAGVLMSVVGSIRSLLLCLLEK